MRRFLLRGCLLLLFVGLIAVLFIACNFFFVQPLQIRQGVESALVDLRFLGEYQANLERLRLTDSTTGHVVWEVEAAKGTEPVWTFHLEHGWNPAQPADFRSFRVLVPPSERFCLRADRGYLLETWSIREAQVTSHRKATLRVPPAREPACEPQPD